MAELDSWTMKSVILLRQYLDMYINLNTSDIPDEVRDKIIIGIKKYPDITTENVHNCLRELNYGKYYEYSGVLTYELKNLQYPKISEAIKDGIIEMYIDFKLRCKSRFNDPAMSTISFHYVAYKYIELHGHDYLLDRFPKTTKYDYVWNI